MAILDKHVPKTIENSPFLHIHRVNEADSAAVGGLKKAIRPAKNVKNDAEDEKAALKLPSFDIAALLYYADQSALRTGFQFELAILAETQRFFDWCWNNQTAARQLRTPDGTRAVLNNDDKMDGLRAISIELDTLAGEGPAIQVRFSRRCGNRTAYRAPSDQKWAAADWISAASRCRRGPEKTGILVEPKLQIVEFEHDANSIGLF